MSIASKLQNILAAKADIKDAINAKGGEVTAATPLADYAQAIEDLPSGDDSFQKLVDRSIVTADIPNNVIQIGDYAFYNCRSLTSISLPTGLTSIGESAFRLTVSLATNITFPNTLTTLKNNCFQQSGITGAITIPASVTSIGSTVFSDDTGITEMYVRANITSFGASCFRQMRNLVKIELPNTLTSIAQTAFQQCISLTSLEIPASVNAIGLKAFDGMNALASLIVNAITPPTIVDPILSTTFAGKIYVPDASVNDYKTASNWSAYAAYIYPLSDYQP